MNSKLIPLYIVCGMLILIGLGYATFRFTGSSSSSTSTSTLSNQCIITVDDQKYDVARLRQTHPGGDVFNCGTDMSSIYHSQHGASVSRIQEYLIK